MAVAALMLFATPAGAESVNDLIGERAEDLRGEAVGHVDELIVDINAGRMLYVVVDREAGHATLPIGALESVSTRNRLRLDMGQANSAAALRDGADPRMRRASKLIGEQVALSDGGPLGVIHDIDFEPETGLVTRVTVATRGGEREYPASVLVNGRFSPVSRWLSTR